MENQQNVCARCCKPLGTSQVRWNQVFWPWRTGDVVPTKFGRRSFAHRWTRTKFCAKFTHSLCTWAGWAALGKLADRFPIPQILPDSTRERTNPPPGFAGDVVEEKHAEPRQESGT